MIAKAVEIRNRALTLGIGDGLRRLAPAPRHARPPCRASTPSSLRGLKDVDRRVKPGDDGWVKR